MEENRVIGSLYGILQRKRILLFLALAGFALCAFAPPVSSESVEEGPLKRNGWSISVVPYVFAISLDGTMGALGLEEEVEAPFKDILRSLSAGAMLDLIVHKDRFGLFVNTLYAKLEDDETVSLLPGTILQRDVKLAATLKMLIMSFGVGYQLGPLPVGQPGRWPDPGCRRGTLRWRPVDQDGRGAGCDSQQSLCF